MRSPRLIAKVPEPYSKTVEDLTANFFPGLEKIKKFTSDFESDNLTTLDDYGYLALWRLFLEDKKNDPNLPVLDVSTETMLSWNVPTHTGAVLIGCTNFRYLCFYSTPAESRAHKSSVCRPSVTLI